MENSIETNEERFAKLQARAEKDGFTRTVLGEPTTEQQLMEDAKVKNLADDKGILNYATTPKKLELPTMGYHVWYMPLTVGDRLVINQITDDNPAVQRDKRNRKKVYLILSKVDEDVFTEKTCDNLGANIVDTILMRYDEEEDSYFLLRLLQRRLSGSS